MKHFILLIILSVCLSLPAMANDQVSTKNNINAIELSKLNQEIVLLRHELAKLRKEQLLYQKQIELTLLKSNQHQESIHQNNLKIQTNELQLGQLKNNYIDLNEKVNQNAVTVISQYDSAIKMISDIRTTLKQSSITTKIGAVTLLLGLMIEIIGATVLAGTHLVKVQQPVFTLKSTPALVDLGMSDINSEPRIDFLGSIASVMLFTGFLLQFSGTLLVLSLSYWHASLMICVAVIPGGLVFYYLLGQSYNQSRSEKLKIILGNIKKNFVPVFGSKCSICGKKVSYENAYVFWNQEPNSENHPYLSTPYKMHFGHYDCLTKTDYYKQPKNRNEQLPKIEIHRCHAIEFLKCVTPDMEKWWVEHNKHWAAKRDTDEKLSFSEYQFRQVLRQIKKLKT